MGAHAPSPPPPRAKEKAEGGAICSDLQVHPILSFSLLKGLSKDGSFVSWSPGKDLVTGSRCGRLQSSWQTLFLSVLTDPQRADSIYQTGCTPQSGWSQPPHPDTRTPKCPEDLKPLLGLCLWIMTEIRAEMLAVWEGSWRWWSHVPCHPHTGLLNTHSTEDELYRNTSATNSSYFSHKKLWCFYLFDFELQIITERKKREKEGQLDCLYEVSITLKPEHSKYTRLAQP